MEFKLNKYIYFKEKDDVVIVMNLLTKSIFALSKVKVDLLKSYNFKMIEETNSAFFSAMQKLDIIIPFDQKEIDQVKLKNRDVIFDDRTYRLTINPTLECNFKCWYCYEQHPKEKLSMSDSTMKAIINHVRKQIESEKISHLIVDWFGGEPLLYFDEIMYPLMQKILKIVKDNNISYSNTITTNGFLINKNRIKQFEEIGLNDFQITLDGNKTQHDKIRFTDGREGSFDKIIENVNLLAQMNDVKISLRINYTEKTLKEITDIIPEISEKAKTKISVLFQQVWQDSAKNKISAEDSINSFKNNGFKVDQYHLNSKGYVCYADKEKQAVINFDRKVFKCTARDFSTYPEDGLLLDSGEIDWNLPLLSKRLGNSTFENEQCQNCNLLPVCYGPCSQKMVEFKESDDFNQICLKGGVIEIIEREIEIFYKTLILN